MAVTPGAPPRWRDEARWLRRPAGRGAPRVWRTRVTVRGATFQARLRACADGGCVVTFPALPPLMARGVTCQHARIKAWALVESYLRGFPPWSGVCAGRERPAAPAATRGLTHPASGRAQSTGGLAALAVRGRLPAALRGRPSPIRLAISARSCT